MFGKKHSYSVKFDIPFKAIRIMTIIVFTIVFLSFIGIIWVGVSMFTNPEAIGQFFGKIVSGFNTAVGGR